VRIHVEDEGSGVSDEHATHILRPFYSTLTQGIGLGLNFVQRICELVGGHLEWQNRSERGCCFTIVLREV
jgi:C4-dicarboxylate-specific signal transduction histidine kinase